MLERSRKPKSYRFDQLADQINDRVIPAEADVERYIGLEHLDSDSLRIHRWGEPSEVESTKLRFQPGDIIFGKRRVYQRKVAVADTEGICSAHAMVLRAKPEVVLPEFLPFFMQSDLFMGAGTQHFGRLTVAHYQLEGARQRGIPSAVDSGGRRDWLGR